MVWSEGNMSLKNPVTTPGINPGDRPTSSAALRIKPSHCYVPTLNLLLPSPSDTTLSTSPMQKSIIIRIMKVMLQLWQISQSCVRLNNQTSPRRGPPFFFPSQICADEIRLKLPWHWQWLNFLGCKVLPIYFTITTARLTAHSQIFILSRPAKFPFTNTYQFTDMRCNNIRIYSSVLF